MFLTLSRSLTSGSALWLAKRRDCSGSHGALQERVIRASLPPVALHPRGRSSPLPTVRFMPRVDDDVRDSNSTMLMKYLKNSWLRSGRSAENPKTREEQAEMRRQAKPHKEKRDEILDELSGSETDEEGEEDEDEDVVIDNYDCDDFGRKKKAPTLVDRAMQQLSLGKNYIVGGDTERRPAPQHHRKAVPMKRTDRGFDDVLWRDDQSQGKDGNRAKLEDPTADAFTKLIAFSESVKKIAHLVRGSNRVLHLSCFFFSIKFKQFLLLKIFFSF